MAQSGESAHVGRPRTLSRDQILKVRYLRYAERRSWHQIVARVGAAMTTIRRAAVPWNQPGGLKDPADG